MVLEAPGAVHGAVAVTHTTGDFRPTIKHNLSQNHTQSSNKSCRGKCQSSFLFQRLFRVCLDTKALSLWHTMFYNYLPVIFADV